MGLIDGPDRGAAQEVRAGRRRGRAAFSLQGRTAVVTGAASGHRPRHGDHLRQGRRHGGAGRPERRQARHGGQRRRGVWPCRRSVAEVRGRRPRRALRCGPPGASTCGRTWPGSSGTRRSSTPPRRTSTPSRGQPEGVFWGTAAAARVMSEAKRGAIVNVASSGGETAVPLLSMYGMSKAGVIQLTHIAAAELGPLGIRANTVAPGFVETGMTSRHWTAGQRHDRRGEAGQTSQPAAAARPRHNRRTPRTSPGSCCTSPPMRPGS